MNTSDLRRGFVIEGWSRGEGRDSPPLAAYLGRQWNGFECPYFNRASASRVIASQDALLASLPAERRLGLYRLAWDGDTVLVSIIPRPGTAAAEATDGPGRIEATLIDGDPHWNLWLGWRWEAVTENGDPVERVTRQQQAALTDIDGRLSCVRHSLRLEPRVRERLPDGSDVIGVYAHLGEFADESHRPIPVSVQIGTVRITPGGHVTLKFDFTKQLPQQHVAG